MKNLKILYYKTKNLRRLLLVIIIVISFCMFVFSRPKDYEYEYKVDKIKVTEKYNKKKLVYYFTFKKGNEEYEYSIENKYINKRGLITKANIKGNCINVKSKITDFNVCKNNNEYITNFYNKINKTKLLKEYKNVKLYDLKDYKYYIWNYNEMLSITKKKQDSIKLFKEDFYTLDLTTTTNNQYLIIPDYNNKYYFTKIYKINSDNDDIKEIDLNKKVYFNSYFLGNVNNYSYIYDLEKELEYKINIKNGKVTKTNYVIMNNGKWEKVSKIKLNKKNQFFKEDKEIKYEVIDNYLYYMTPDNKIKMSNLIVSKVLYTNYKDILFLSNDTIYHANIDTGIDKVMKYSEWQFNNKNIYIFEN